MNKYDQEARLQNVLDQLAHTVGETVHAAVLDGNIVIHVARALPGSGPHMAVPIGTKGPAHVTALGKALLATLPREEILRRYPDNRLETPAPRSISNRTKLLEDLRRVAERGYAIDDEESAPGIKCIGAPIFGPAATAIFALSVTSMPIHFDGGRLDEVARAVVAAAGVATTSFGGSVPAGWGRKGEDTAGAPPAS
jgi:DNA-binding IclR family transcriptional regulator